MSEKLVYADLNLTDPTRPKLQKVTDVQDSTYAEVKAQSPDRSTAVSYTSSGKSCCSRTRVAVLVAVIILLLVLAVCLILMYHPTASRPADSKTFSIICEDAHAPGLELTTENGMDPMRYGENQKENHTGCPKHWEKNGGKCYFFSQRQDEANWNDSRKECTDMKADLVIIDNKDELMPLQIYNPLPAVYTKHPYTAANTFTNFLSKRSRNSYYLLGLTYSHSERKWKWINNMELSSDMFCIGGDFTDYFCAVIGHRKVETAPCSGSLSTQNMCEKDADISESQKEY
ncbi:killer cell lectin-like receptor subfamily B member 1F-like protein [Amazona aestiva]|uniref:Killer cell lectin-like receptor subfamily B member 1F-like protein n=1 Tax=Amazona aestiva TaxID=12930 RepID=A0A0Q3UPM5_AMAAE|nr:killer cell lectin-like receptor subfamily B member 1F-like protein [Amazona aestiva]